MNEVMYGASTETERSRFGGARTVKPWLWSSVATGFQLDASAHAPWTRTMVGCGMESPVMVAHASRSRRSLPGPSVREAGGPDKSPCPGWVGVGSSRQGDAHDDGS